MLKSDRCYYPEENFVQEDDTLRELTVEITLAEYRDLITGQAANAALIGRLEAEKEQLEEENKKLKECIVAISDPTFLDAFRDVVARTFNMPSPLSNTAVYEENNERDEEADNAEET